MIYHVFADAETLGMPEDRCVTLSLSAIKFTQEELEGMALKDINIHTFTDPGRSIDIKFDVRHQRDLLGRTVNSGTLAWWKTQSEDAKKVLKADPKRDVTVYTGMKQFIEWLPSTDMKKIMFWCRGTNFDMPLIQQLMKDAGINFEPAFWFYRDVRSFLSGVMMDPTVDKVPLSEEQMEGFVYHNSLCDCAKDVMMIFMGMRYASGTNLPEYPHKDTVPRKR